MTSDDADASEHYDDLAHREPAAGEPRRRRARTLAGHGARPEVEECGGDAAAKYFDAIRRRLGIARRDK
jgi:hypothetical protein